jgi:hypothetical protein
MASESVDRVDVHHHYLPPAYFDGVVLRRKSPPFVC